MEPEESEVALLRDRVTAARESIAAILAEVDDISLRQNPHIAATYEVLVGRYETELLKSEIAARRARRKLAIAHRAVAISAPFDDEAVEAELDGEFSEWDAKVKRAVARYYEMRARRDAGTADVEACAEMRELYVRLVARLHPEIRTECKPIERLMFLAAQMAYQEGDLDALRSLDSLTFDLPDGSEISLPVDEDVTAALHAEAVVTETTLDAYRDAVEELRGQFPYSYKDKLADEAWVASRVADLKTMAAQNESARQDDLHRIVELEEGRS
jgi:hypothetical protein